MPFWIRRVLSAGYIAVITALSLFPSKDLPDVPMFPHADKVIHFLMYGLMAFSLGWAFPAKTINRLVHYSGIVLLCAAYGLFMELLQGTFTQLDRTFSLTDEAANLAGAIAFTVAWRTFEKKSEKTF